MTTGVIGRAFPANRPKVAFAMRSNELRDLLFTAEVMERLDKTAELVSPDVLNDMDSDRSRQVLGEVDALITGWGSPKITTEVIDNAPHLKVVAHAAGTVKYHIDRVVWERGIAVTTAAVANGVPVTEFTLAMILLAAKNTFGFASWHKQHQGQGGRAEPPFQIGNNHTVVGIIGASSIGRGVLELLAPFAHRKLLADPTLTAVEAAGLGAELVPLSELMARSQIVSLHAPILPSTIGMIGAAELAALPEGATFINTARGVLVDHDALRAEAASGRISVILDVTDPEPLPVGDVLYTLPNVILTPHIAGSMGNELPAMAHSAVTEIERLAAGQPYAHEVSIEALDRMA